MLNTTDRIIKHKTGMLNLAGEPGNVSKACQVMGYGRDTFHRYKSAVEDGGVEALSERTRRKPDPANRVDRATEDAVIKSATDFPAYGQARTSNKLDTRKNGTLRAILNGWGVWPPLSAPIDEIRGLSGGVSPFAGGFIPWLSGVGAGPGGRNCRPDWPASVPLRRAPAQWFGQTGQNGSSGARGYAPRQRVPKTSPHLPARWPMALTCLPACGGECG